MTRADQLSRRERQIMDVLYRLREASAKDVMENIENAPSYSSVRTLIGKLVEKGHVAHKQVGPKYVYYPLVEIEKASKSALTNIVKTFFNDSPFLAVNSLLGMNSQELSEEELDRLNQMIKHRRQELMANKADSNE